MRHSSTLAGYLLATSLTSFAMASTTHAQVWVDSIASESLNQITPRGAEEGFGPAIADDGTVAFWASTPPHRNLNMIYVGDRLGMWSVNVSAHGLTRPRSVKINRTQMVFIADAADGRGVYLMDRTGGTFRPLHEERYPGKLPFYFEVALSPNGSIAYSSICSDCGRGGGGLVRGSYWTNQFDELQHGVVNGGAFLYNTQYLDVNDEGQVAVQSEYLPGYRRGVFVLSHPGQTLADVPTTAEGLDIGNQPRPAINNRGEVAYILSRSQIWISTPTQFGSAKSGQPYLDTSGPYASFERVDIDNNGNIVFQARLDDGRVGIFTGPDPVAHKVMVVGDRFDPFVIGAIQIMGGMNQHNQVAVIASVEPMPDLHVLLASNIPPTPR